MTSSEPVVTREHVIEGAWNLGIAGQPICIHVSLRSFPRLEDGAATLIHGLLLTCATLLVATMAKPGVLDPASAGRPSASQRDGLRQLSTG